MSDEELQPFIAAETAKLVGLSDDDA